MENTVEMVKECVCKEVCVQKDMKKLKTINAKENIVPVARKKVRSYIIIYIEELFNFQTICFKFLVIVKFGASLLVPLYIQL